MNVAKPGKHCGQAFDRLFWRLRRPMLWALCTAVLACGSQEPGVGTSETIPDKRCGADPSAYFSANRPEDLEAFAECTVLVGHFQEDSVTELQNFAALKNVRKIEGYLNVFRSPGFVTLHGLENLERVEGHVAIHQNENLVTLAALEKLHTITGNLLISGNPKLPQSEVQSLGARVMVGGTKNLGQAIGP